MYSSQRATRSIESIIAVFKEAPQYLSLLHNFFKKVIVKESSLKEIVLRMVATLLFSSFVRF